MQIGLDSRAAAAELLRRRRIRSSFGAWCEHALEPLGQKPAEHHKLLIRELEAVAAGETKRLMINMPPGSAKSTYGSMLFPAWLLANKPNLDVIGASNTASLAESFSRRVMSFIRDNPRELGYGLSRESAEEWETTNGGRYRAAGVGGAIAGKRAGIVIIDDPTRSRADAESPTVRESQWNWFTADLRTRLKPDASIVVIMTRWHMDDLGGRLLERQPGLWKVVSLPAMAEENDALGRQPGEWLWDEDGYGYGAEIKKVYQEYEAAGAMRDWSALYQQRPTPASGGIFKVEAIPALEAAPAGLRPVRAWDLASTAATGTRDPDWTVGVLLAKNPYGNFVVLDMVRLRGGPEETENAILATAARDGRSVPVLIPQDPGQAGKPMWIEEPVLMADGTRKRLGSVTVGDRVINGKGYPTKVLAVHEQGILPTLKIKTASGREVISAKDHPFLTPDGWINSEDLKIDSVLALMSKPKIENSQKRTLEEFRLAGYFIGDGAVGRATKAGKTGSCHAEFCCHDDVEFVDFEHCVKSVGGSVVNRARKGSYGTKGLQGWLRETELNGSTAYNKRIPLWAFDGSPEQIANMLGAYFACDGFISKSSRDVMFYSVSKDLLEDVQHLLLRLGISSTLKTKNGKYLETRHVSYLLRMNAQDDAYGRFLRRIPIYHSVKFGDLQRLKDDSRYRRFDEEYLPDRIVSIEDIGINECRCITVESEASFVAHDFVVHNSQVSYLTRRLSGYTVKSSPESGDKATRAMPVASQVNVGNLSIVQGAWNRAFIEELAGFPGAKDDIVDALSRAFAEVGDTSASERFRAMAS